MRGKRHQFQTMRTRKFVPLRGGNEKGAKDWQHRGCGLESRRGKDWLRGMGGRLGKNPSRIGHLWWKSLKDMMGPVWHPGTAVGCLRWGSHGGGEGAGEVPCGSLRSAHCRANRWGTPLPHHRRQRWSAEAIKDEVLSGTRPPPFDRRERLT
jgi:hypothetical protein